MLVKNRITLSYDPLTETKAAEERAKVLVCQGYSLRPIKETEGKYQKLHLIRYDNVNTANA